MTIGDFMPTAQHGSLLSRWMEELGENLMWIGTPGEHHELHCTPNQTLPDARLHGWSDARNIMDLVPTLLEIACPEQTGHVIIRTTEALYVAFCIGGQPNLLLGIDPSFPLAKLGFA
jgi:hypothetical protein